jgi:predicted nucleic acid-binding protein
MVLSPQAINELFACLLRFKVPTPVAIEIAQEALNFVAGPIDQGVIKRALYIFARYQTSWWDALMIGWAVQSGCTILLSEDAQGAPEIEGVRIVSPFDFEPTELIK